jgi:hypothetical protein
LPRKKSYPLRIDPEIYDALQMWAEDELRSLNGHLEYLLRESLKRSGRFPKSRPKPEVSE